jgi:hypothetical protein
VKQVLHPFFLPLGPASPLTKNVRVHKSSSEYFGGAAAPPHIPWELERIFASNLKARRIEVAGRTCAEAKEVGQDLEGLNESWDRKVQLSEKSEKFNKGLI